jgi:hypothetical protein
MRRYGIMRNWRCKKYEKCLKKAAILDVDMMCQYCSLRNDKTYDCTSSDVYGTLNLLSVLFANDAVFERYIQTSDDRLIKACEVIS